MMWEVSDAALDNYYRNNWIRSRGWDPYEGPYADDDDEDEEEEDE